MGRASTGEVKREEAHSVRGSNIEVQTPILLEVQRERQHTHSTLDPLGRDQSNDYPDCTGDRKL